MTFIMDSVKKGTIKVPWLALKKLKVLESLLGTLEFSMSPQLNTRVLHCTKDQHDIRRVSRLVAPKPPGEILKMYSPLRRKKWMPFLSLKGGSLFFRPRGEYIFRCHINRQKNGSDFFKLANGGYVYPWLGSHVAWRYLVDVARVTIGTSKRQIPSAFYQFL